MTLPAKAITFIAMTAALLCSCSEHNNLAERVGVCNRSSVEATVQAGANYIELGVSSCLVPDKSDSVWNIQYETLKDLPLPTPTANGFFPSYYRLVGPDADESVNLEYVETAMQRGGMLGLKLFVLGSGGARNIPEGFDKSEAVKQFVSLCKGIALLGEKYGIDVAIEPLRPKETNFINSVKEGMEIVKAVDNPHLGVLADFFHMAEVNEDPQEIVNAGRNLLHCHIAEKGPRTAPGVNGDDFTPYLKALKAIKYQGRLSLECGWGKYDEEVAAAIAETRRQINLVF